MELKEKCNLSWLEDPEIFQVNRLEPHSDHKVIDETENIIEPISLNGKWYFKYYENLQEINFDFIDDPSVLNSEIIVPGHMQLQGYGKPQYVNTMYPWDGHEKIIPPHIPKNFNPTGIYGIHFDLPEDYKNKTVRISFQGVESCFYLWLNGRFIGYSENTFCPAEFDLTEAIKDKGNYLCAMVIRFCSGSWLEDQDFWRFSGIFRDVYLYKADLVHIEDLDLQPLINRDLDEGILEAKIQVKNILNKKLKLELIMDGLTAEGESSNSEIINLTLNINRPNLWSAEIPNLYETKIIIRDAETDSFITGAQAEIGFRRFELKDNIMSINGKRIIFNGVNRHEFNCRKGRAINEEDIEKDIKILKRNNFNAVRTSHYPNNSEFYRLCDKYGLYVIDETNLESHGTWMIMSKAVENKENIVPGDNVKWQEAVLSRGKAMVERDKNHPSILMWSCGNEAYGGTVIKKLSDWFHERDSQRLVHYEGVFWDRRYDDTSDVESRMYTFAKEVESYLQDNPKKPFILCEYSHAMGNSFGGVKRYIDLIDKYPTYQGGFIWDFMDQGIYAETEDGRAYFAVGGDFDDRPNDGYFCGDGLLFADGSETEKIKEAKVLYSPVKIRCEGNRVTVINNHLFKDTNDYKFLWSIRADGEVIERGSFEVVVLPQQQRTVELKLKEIEIEGELILDCSMVLKKADLWAEAGYEIAFGQSVLRAFAYEEKPQRKASIINGDCNVGIKMADSFALVDKNSGKLVSLNNGKSELLKVGLKPDFWRAPTDNDIGNKSNLKWSQWKIASLYQQLEKLEVDEEKAVVSVYLSMPTNPITKCKMEYSFYEENLIKVYMRIIEGGGDAPAMGVVFEMDSGFNNLVWYGNNQEESYGDRENGSRVELCNSTIDKQYVPYLNPQECGNKTQLRYFRVHDNEGNGIELRSNKIFEASALPYSSHELEAAKNILHLPPSNNKVVVSAYEKKCGVGGDDSWGAPVHEEYRVKLDETSEFILYMKIL